MNNIINRLIHPLSFNQETTTPKGTTPKGTTPKGTTPKGTKPKGTTPKGTKPKVSSHIYLGQIKHLKETHKLEIEKKDKTISELNYRIEVLELSNSMKAFREISKKSDEIKKATSISRNTLANLKYLKKNTLEYILGHDINNNLIKGNVSNEPHLLISGKTGSGKSVTLFNVLTSICYSNTPKTLEISLIDPKILSFGDSRIDTSPFLKEEPSIFDNKQALKILKNAFNDMMSRYKLMRKKGVKNYRDIGLKAHVIFIDEVFELLEGSDSKEILSYITRIASLGRAGGVHLIMATQSPRAKTLSGTLKANLEFIGHRMSNPTESKLIELPKAHELKGKGDGLRVIESEIVRFQATFLDIEKDETYQFFNPIHPIHHTNPKQTQNRPKTDPIHQPNTPTQNTKETAFKELLEEIISTVDEKGKIKPKTYFIDIKKRVELKKWDKALNVLKANELITFKNGIGYFLTVDYSVATNIIN